MSHHPAELPSGVPEPLVLSGDLDLEALAHCVGVMRDSPGALPAPVLVDTPALLLDEDTATLSSDQPEPHALPDYTLDDTLLPATWPDLLRELLQALGIAFLAWVLLTGYILAAQSSPFFS